MCFASPKEQVDPSKPANYALADSYGQVTSSTVTPDGVVHGGDTIAQTYQDNLKAGRPNMSPTTTRVATAPRTNKPAARAEYMPSGANVRM